jgi:hypothetical protein
MHPMTSEDKETVQSFITIAVNNAIKAAAKELEGAIEKSFTTLNKLLSSEIINIKSLQNANKSEIDNISERQRIAELTVNTLATNFVNHTKDHSDTKKTKWLVISNIIALIAVVVAVVAMLA